MQIIAVICLDEKDFVRSMFGKETMLSKGGGVLGTVTKANKTDIFITALMDDDGKELEIKRKYVEKIK